MTLTTIAGPAPPDLRHLSRPPSHPERFERSDFIAALIVGSVTLVVYIATLAPNVTLEDSGELITAAVGFGVPHPPGYPLWTFFGFLLSHLLPVGNLAWRANLESAIFGAIANALLVLLVCHSGRWLVQRWTEPGFEELGRRFCFYGGLLAGFTLGFSDVMWSQAVVAEVYTLNALFVNLVLLLFYFWMLAPEKTYRLIVTVFVFALGLTNHHTLIQMIPAFLLASALVRAGVFWSVFLAINLFSLTILIDLGWLSLDPQIEKIGFRMALLVLFVTVLVSFIRTRALRPRRLLTGALIGALVCFGAHYLLSGTDHPASFERISFHLATFWQWGSFAHPGWLQIHNAGSWAMVLLVLSSCALLWNSQLNRWLILTFCLVGWAGLLPYGYMQVASRTNPPMNWGYTKQRDGFFYAVSRRQYPTSLPWLIDKTLGSASRAVDSILGAASPGKQDLEPRRPEYWKRLAETFYYYGDNLQDNFTIPLLCLVLAIFIFVRQCDRPQLNWLWFLATAFFFLGFMLHLIEPPEGFDFTRNLQYKVFHLQSHCIFVLVLGYGAIAALLALAQHLPELSLRYGVPVFGAPSLLLALLPLMSNFNDCNQANHWFGYLFGAQIMVPMEKNAIYLGGSDPGRFVPTYMAFVESQQDPRWKHVADFDRRDVSVITQNAVCDLFYCHYIRDQYDARFRTKPEEWSPFQRWLGRDEAYPAIPIHCLSDQELDGGWDEYRRLHQSRIQPGQPMLRPGTNDVYELDAIITRYLFDKNKATHAFYLEQSEPFPWMYPYLTPWGIIFKVNNDPLPQLPPDLVARDRRYWDELSARLLADPGFRLDDDATLTYSKLADFHADLYRWRGLIPEQEHFLRLSRRLCPQLQEAVSALAKLLCRQGKFDEAQAEVEQAERDDPRNEDYADVQNDVLTSRQLSRSVFTMRADLKKRPYDLLLHLNLARALEAEGKSEEGDQLLRESASLTNWSESDVAGIVRYYVEEENQPLAAIAFLQERIKIDPKNGQVIYNLASLQSMLGQTKEAFATLRQAVTIGGPSVALSAQYDARFGALRSDREFQAYMAPIIAAEQKKKSAERQTPPSPASTPVPR